MPVKIRLARRGRKKKPYYHIIIADARAPRDGKFIENIGSYNPMTVPASIELDRDKAFDWLMKGAQPTNTVRAILKFQGVYYRKHLMRGVHKGALSEEKAMEMYNEWVEAKEAKIAARKEETKKKKEEYWKMLSGEIKAPKKKADTEAAEAFRETSAEDAPPAEDAAPQETPATEAPAKEEKAVAAPPAPEAPPAAEENAVAAPPVPEPTPAPEAPKAEVPEAPAKEEANPEPVAAAPAADAKPDDLTKIEGIGPAISKLLAASGIITFSDLAAKPVDEVKQVLTDAGSRFKMHDPATWGKQADMAAKGEWDALKKWQDELDGGKETGSSEEE